MGRYPILVPHLLQLVLWSSDIQTGVGVPGEVSKISYGVRKMIPANHFDSEEWCLLGCYAVWLL
jgi:hypothetical protein